MLSHARLQERAWFDFLHFLSMPVLVASPFLLVKSFEYFESDMMTTCDLTGMMVSRGNYPSTPLWQISEHITDITISPNPYHSSLNVSSTWMDYIFHRWFTIYRLPNYHISHTSIHRGWWLIIPMSSPFPAGIRIRIARWNRPPRSRNLPSQECSQFHRLPADSRRAGDKNVRRKTKKLPPRKEGDLTCHKNSRCLQCLLA